MKILKSVHVWILVVMTMSAAQAQDIHFSQYYLSPLNLNPALTGVMEEQQRASVHYRNQWAVALGSAGYNTFSASYDRRMEVGETDYFGVGGTLWGDVAGEANFGSVQAKLSFAYTKKIMGSWRTQVRRNQRKSGIYISAGADAGITQRRVSSGDLRWPSQVLNGKYEESVGTRENIPNSSFLYPDITAGLMIFGLDQDGNSFYVGGSMSHLNQANISFLNQTESLNQRLTIHAGGEYVLSRRMSVVPNLVYMKQGPHLEIVPGGAVRFNVDPRNDNSDYFDVGAWMRIVQNAQLDGTAIGSDALILFTKFSFSKYSIGLSYDHTVSSLSNAAAGNGSFELSVVYRIMDPGFRGYLSPRF